MKSWSKLFSVPIFFILSYCSFFCWFIETDSYKFNWSHAWISNSIAIPKIWTHIIFQCQTGLNNMFFWHTNNFSEVLIINICFLRDFGHIIFNKKNLNFLSYMSICIHLTTLQSKQRAEIIWPSKYAQRSSYPIIWICAKIVLSLQQCFKKQKKKVKKGNSTAIPKKHCGWMIVKKPLCFRFLGNNTRIVCIPIMTIYLYYVFLWKLVFILIYI